MEYRKGSVRTERCAQSSPLPDNAPKLPPQRSPYVYSVDELRRLLDATSVLHINNTPLQARKGHIADRQGQAPPQARSSGACQPELSVCRAGSNQHPVVSGGISSRSGQAGFSLFLTGPSGVFKSALAGLCQQHYGASMDGSSLPANFADTANALESMAFSAKDELLVGIGKPGDCRHGRNIDSDPPRNVRSGMAAGRWPLKHDPQALCKPWRLQFNMKPIGTIASLDSQVGVSFNGNMTMLYVLRLGKPADYHVEFLACLRQLEKAAAVPRASERFAARKGPTENLISWQSFISLTP